ncbi:hypothetical protein B0T19DRAFT_155435 [Cercophora scortea]|uniref:Uncharacterized protein n=1 Tax=Cercophora scortea TaxID=314031 RepID=A0AAE0ILJ8_9PEZI|nr:hypothetical protein B0T19DRAFT_155435 [Cercophora scortea]
MELSCRAWGSSGREPSRPLLGHQRLTRCATVEADIYASVYILPFLETHFQLAVGVVIPSFIFAVSATHSADSLLDNDPGAWMFEVGTRGECMAGNPTPSARRIQWHHSTPALSPTVICESKFKKQLLACSDVIMTGSQKRQRLRPWWNQTAFAAQ